MTGQAGAGGVFYALPVNKKYEQIAENPHWF
jgi:hypothetical protein